MPIQPIHSFDDPALAPYRNLKDKELARDGGRFIAEGENVVRRLLKSSIPVESVLLSERKKDAIAPLPDPAIPVLLASDAVIAQIIGFEFHSGVMACGIRPPSPPIESVIPAADKPVILAVCQEITNTENMGSLIRVSAGMGADAIVVGERCCDPFFRQSVRVSMGTIFSLPLVRSENLLNDLDKLRNAGVECLAAVLAADAHEVGKLRSSPRVAVVFGNEAQGLDAQTIARCDRRITIPMKRGTDSLNVAIAAAVILHQLSLR
jgi:tRNA G18 (ribose-2'-O)-methylase SpoU